MFHKSFPNPRNPFPFNLAILIALLFASFPSYSQNKINWQERGNNKDASFYEVQQDFHNYWQAKTPRKGQGFKAFKRWEAYMSPRVYPSGDMKLPSLAYENFMKWWNESQADKNAQLPCNSWTSVGPNVIPSGYDGAVGRVNFLRFDPTNTNTMFVGTPDGGLWKSTNAGASWTTNTDFLPIIGVSDLLIDPTNTQTMYLSTGTWNGGDKKSIGILKSTDGGATWNTTSLSWSVLDNHTIRKMLMHPANPSVMMAATDVGIFKTIDGWDTYWLALSSDELFDIEFKPNDPNTVFASGKDYWRSTTGGDSWAANASGLPDPSEISRTLMAVTPANPNYVYMVVGNLDNGYLGTYRSTDGGLTFTEQSNSPNILGYDKVNPGGVNGQAFHDLAIVVSPTDANLVTVGGISAFQSADGGITWNCVAYWGGYDPESGGGDDTDPLVYYVHADIQELQYLPGSSTTLFAMCDGGIYKSTTNGIGEWADLSANLSIAQQYAIGLSASSPDLLVAGEQDIGNVRWRGGNDWARIGGGDGLDCFIHRNDNNIMVLTDPGGKMEMSFDGGDTREPITGLPDGNDNAAWLCPIAQDPVDPSTVYVGGRLTMYRKTDLFTNNDGVWETLGTPPGSEFVLRFAIAPSDNSVIYAIKYDAISRSDDAGANWTDITGSLPVADAQLSNVTVSNTDANKAWVTLSGYSEGNKVFKTTDGGASWTNISEGLPNLPMNTIVYVNGSANDATYLGADIGIYYRNNDSNAWTLYNSGLPNTAVRDLEIFYPSNKLRAGTYGRGTWESDICDLVTPSDIDGDGYASADDCDDNNAGINPGTTETCNGLDDICNGQTDEGLLLTFYADADGDGYGNAAVTEQACTAPSNFVNNSSDCDDANASVHPSATETCNGLDDNCNGQTDEGLLLTFYADADNDGFGNPGVSTTACAAPLNYVTNSTDCNDNSANDNPNAPEACDGLDNNCNGTIDDNVTYQDYYLDQDGDGYGAGTAINDCQPPSASHVLQSGDCDDLAASINPAASETCDGLDNNCDGQTDEGLMTIFYEDADGDGFGNASVSQLACSAPTNYVADNTDCNDANAAVFPGATEVCNSIDDNCNGQTDEGLLTTFYEDADGDGFGNASVSQLACSAPTNYVADNTDCNDANAAVFPGATEVCNSIDDNCNGQTDEGLLATFFEDADSDGFGNVEVQTQACTLPSGYATNSQDCDDDNAAIFPGAIEIANNGIDEDCDGEDLVEGLDELAEYGIRVIPNPFSDFIILENVPSEGFNVEVLNLTGQPVINKQAANQAVLHCPALPAGVYFVKITEGKTSRKKIALLVRG